VHIVLDARSLGTRREHHRAGAGEANRYVFALPHADGIITSASLTTRWTAAARGAGGLQSEKDFLLDTLSRGLETRSTGATSSAASPACVR